MSLPSIAVANVKSFGDFVIAHSVLNRVESHVKSRVRLIACNHLKVLSENLPKGVCVTLIDSGEDRVPALFDVKKCGAFAAVKSALSLRRTFQRIERNDNEALAFDAIGVRERFIAGRWPVMSPRIRGPNIYETYSRFLTEQIIPVASALPIQVGGARSVGIFAESRLVEKRLPASTLSVIFDRAVQAGLDAKLIVLDGDIPPQREYPCVVNISRNFESLSNAIKSVDSVISADSLPAHLAEYFKRPVFVASPAPNEFWLPYECFTKKRWGIFSNESQFIPSLDKFFRELRAPQSRTAT